MCFGAEEEAMQALIAETPNMEILTQDMSMEVFQATLTVANHSNTADVANTGTAVGDHLGKGLMQAQNPQAAEDLANMDDEEGSSTATEEGAIKEEAADERPIKKPSKKPAKDTTKEIKRRRGRNEPEPDWSASMRDRQSMLGTSRSRHACDRCRFKKTRCQTGPHGSQCIACLQDGLACLVTDPVTNETFERGAAGRFMAQIKMLEQQLHDQEISFASRVNEVEQRLQKEITQYRTTISEISGDNAWLRSNNARMMRELQSTRSYPGGFVQPPFGPAAPPAFVDPRHTQVAPHSVAPLSALWGPYEENSSRVPSRSPHPY